MKNLKKTTRWCTLAGVTLLAAAAGATGKPGALQQPAAPARSQTYDSLVTRHPDAPTPPGPRPLVLAVPSGLVVVFDGAVYGWDAGQGAWERRGTLGGEAVSIVALEGELRGLLRSGRVVRSTDGGRTWTLLTELLGAAGGEIAAGGFGPDGSAWASADAPNPSVALVVGAEVRKVGGTRSSVAAGFRGAGALVAASSSGEVYRATDDGSDLRRVASLQGATLNDLAFADGSHGWIATGEGNVLETTDGGTSWLPRPVAGASALDAVGLSGTAFWVVGRSDRNGVLYVSLDGGVRWRNVLTAPPPLSRPTGAGSAVWLVDGAGGIWTAATVDGSWRRTGALGVKMAKPVKPKRR